MHELLVPVVVASYLLYTATFAIISLYKKKPIIDLQSCVLDCGPGSNLAIDSVRFELRASLLMERLTDTTLET